MKLGLLKALLALAATLHLTGCAKTVEWKEEVRLGDGRTIVVEQKRRCEGGDATAKTDASCIAREFWLTLQLPEFSSQPIVWHEKLRPFAVNVHQGRLYVVGFPSYLPEFRAYGASNPPYFGFVWSGSGWTRIAFAEIPPAIYAANMLIENIPRTRTDYLSLARKYSQDESGDPAYPAYLRRIDPKFSMKPY